MIDRGRYLEAEEAGRFLAVARAYRNRHEPLIGRDYVLLTLALNSGAREGELCRLCLQDYKIDDRGRDVLDLLGKRGRRRRVYLPRDMADLLRRFIERRRLQGARGLDPIFSNAKGLPLPQRTARDMFHRIREAAGLPETLSFHSLRHTFATHYYRNRHDIVSLKELLGHASLKTTQIYTHTSPEELHNSMQELPEAFSPRRRARREEPQAQ